MLQPAQSRGDHTSIMQRAVSAPTQAPQKPESSTCPCGAVALLTTRISQLAAHMAVHRKDYSSRRGLEAALAQRRKLLSYLRRTSFPTYAQLISRLGLRDTYQKLVRSQRLLDLKGSRLSNQMETPPPFPAPGGGGGGASSTAGSCQY